MNWNSKYDLIYIEIMFLKNKNLLHKIYINFISIIKKINKYIYNHYNHLVNFKYDYIFFFSSNINISNLYDILIYNYILLKITGKLKFECTGIKIFLFLLYLLYFTYNNRLVIKLVNL